MKTIKLFLIVSISLLTVHLHGQIKLLNNGVVGLGATVPSGFNVSLYGRYTYIGTSAYYSNGMIKIDCGNSNPRIWSPSGSIVFYNNDIGDYQNIQVKTCIQYSDVNGKTNISTLSNSLATIKKLRGVSFNWKTDALNVNSGQAKPAKLEYGFIAQEVEQVVPDLVMTIDSTKGKMLSYTGIIPILVEALKDQQNTIDAQSLKLHELETAVAALNVTPKSSLKSAKITSDTPSGNPTNITDNATNAFLYQNTPNPFTFNTEIKYYLPEGVNTAILFIYDMQGSQIKSVPIQQHENGSITINATELKAGMYLYTLVADGKEIDTKRMILTQ